MCRIIRVYILYYDHNRPKRETCDTAVKLSLLPKWKIQLSDVSPQLYGRAIRHENVRVYTNVPQAKVRSVGKKYIEINGVNIYGVNIRKRSRGVPQFTRVNEKPRISAGFWKILASGISRFHSRAYIDYRWEDGRVLVTASCVAFSSPDSLSSCKARVSPGIRSLKKQLSDWARCQRDIGGIYFTKKWRAETLQPGSEFDNFKPPLKSGIFNCISWLNSSFFRGDDRIFMKEGVKTYLMAPSRLIFFLSSHLWSVPSSLSCCWRLPHARSFNLDHLASYIASSRQGFYSYLSSNSVGARFERGRKAGAREGEFCCCCVEHMGPYVFLNVVGSFFISGRNRSICR